MGYSKSTLVSNDSTLTLNEQQEIAVNNISSHLLLLAGAGTGKTNTVAIRVAQLLIDAVSPQKILCLTFTNRACREMSERIIAVAGEVAENVTVRTVHGFCAELLRNTPHEYLDFSPDFAICDAQDAVELIRETMLEAVGRAPDEHSAVTLQGFISMIKDHQLENTGESVSEAVSYVFAKRREAVEHLCVDLRHNFDSKFFTFLFKYGTAVVNCYNNKLRANNLLDFSDLLLYAAGVLLDPKTAVLWKSRFRYIHIDEVQDVSISEYGLIRRLCDEAVTLFCGDFNQTIYSWRGSNPQELIRRITDDFHPLVVKFTKNYRSSTALLCTAQNFLFHAFQIGSSSGYDPLCADCNDIKFGNFDTAEQEATWLYSEIKTLNISDYSRIAIITRNNRACTDVCRLLKLERFKDRDSENPVRFILAEEFRLLKRAEIKDALACISLLVNHDDSESLRRVITNLVPGIGATTTSSIATYYREGLGVSLTDFVNESTQNTGDFFEPLLSALENENVVVFDVESTGTDVDSDEIIQIAAVRIASDGTVLSRFERFLRPQRIVGESEKIHGFSDDFLAKNGDIPAKALNDFLDFVKDSIIIGHNVTFDISITTQNLRRYGIEREFKPMFYDTLDLSRRFMMKLENHKLSTVSEALMLKNKPSHDAMDDILATADVLIALCDSYIRPKSEARRACYAKYAPKFLALTKTLTSLRKKEFPQARIALEELIAYFSLREHCQTPEKQANLLLFCDFVDEYADRTKTVFRQLAGLLELSALCASELDRMTKTANKTAVITAHQAKGCEFDYVFIPTLMDNVFPAFQSIKDGNLQEEKRVFYVALTRAKKQVWISWARHDTRGYACKPSRFLEMLSP